MSRYKAYAEYKDSGVEWLGNIPNHWTLTRIKESAKVINGYPFDSKKFEPSQGTPLVRIRDINSSKTEVGFVGDVPTESLINDGDILIGMDGDFNVAKWRGGEAALNQRVACIRASDKILQNFIYYAIPFNMKVTNDLTYFTTVKHLSSTDILKTRFAFPAVGELGQIVNFLDHETAKIDTLIAKQQGLIKLLKEKRQAVISHAVTKGLNLNAPMRDSGVEWLGEVPEHWDTGRLSYQVDVLVDGTHHSPESYPEGDYLYVTAKNIKEHGFDFSNISYISSKDHEEIYSRCSVKKDDVLYIKDGATAGIAMVNDLEEEFSLLSSVALIRPRKNILISRYLKHHLNASVFKDEMLNRLSGGAMTRFTIDGISRFNVFIPPIKEQQDIVEYIDSKTSQMDVLIAKAEKGISFIQERRTALISAAVTGKIDVRDWQAAPLPEMEDAAA